MGIRSLTRTRAIIWKQSTEWFSARRPLSLPFCWTKFWKKKTQNLKWSFQCFRIFAQKFALLLQRLVCQEEKSFPKPDFSQQIFQTSNQISPQNFKTHFCRHGNPNRPLGPRKMDFWSMLNVCHITMGKTSHHPSWCIFRGCLIDADSQENDSKECFCGQSYFSHSASCCQLLIYHASVCGIERERERARVRGFQRGVLWGGEISIIGVVRAPVAINFASNPCENLWVYIGFNKEAPHKKRKINYCKRCAHPPQLLRFLPLAKTPLWKPPRERSKETKPLRAREIQGRLNVSRP